jgi:IS5 family transposase
MRPPERRDSGQHDPLRSRLDQMIDLAHPLAKLARSLDWGFLELRLGAAYTDRPGRPPLPTRLMAGLAILTWTSYSPRARPCGRESRACRFFATG